MESSEGHEENEVILLDTQAMIWLSYEPNKLSRTAAAAIRRSRRSEGLAISAISLWEFAWLINAGSIAVNGTVEAAVEEIASRFLVRPLTPRIAAQASQFGSDYPRDPGDRIIGATALIEGLTLITSDATIRRCHYIRTLW